jgi:hypothetical protein
MSGGRSGITKLIIMEDGKIGRRNGRSWLKENISKCYREEKTLSCTWLGRRKHEGSQEEKKGHSMVMFVLKKDCLWAVV